MSIVLRSCDRHGELFEAVFLGLFKAHPIVAAKEQSGGFLLPGRHLRHFQINWRGQEANNENQVHEPHDDEPLAHGGSSWYCTKSQQTLSYGIRQGGFEPLEP